MNREGKKVFVKDFHEKIKGMNHFVLTDYRGLKVREINQMRNELKKVSVEFCVVKNTLLKRAAQGTPLEILADHFKGPTAIALAKGDPVIPSKVLVAFLKAYPKFDLRIGLYDGRTIDAETIKNVISKLPSREELVGKVLYLLQAPMGQLLLTLRGIPLKLIGTLVAIKEAKEKA